MNDFGGKEFGGKFFSGFFPGFFFLSKVEKYTGKKLAETQSMKIQAKSEEIPVCKNVGKIMQNVDSRRLTPKSAKLMCYPLIKIQSRENTGKELKISKTGMADRWDLVQEKKTILTVWNVGQFDIGQIGCGTSLV